MQKLIGTANIIAINDVTKVPTIAGKAPKFSETGSHSDEDKKLSPNR